MGHPGLNLTRSICMYVVVAWMVRMSRGRERGGIMGDPRLGNRPVKCLERSRADSLSQLHYTITTSWRVRHNSTTLGVHVAMLVSCSKLASNVTTQLALNTSKLYRMMFWCTLELRKMGVAFAKVKGKWHFDFTLVLSIILISTCIF